MMFPFLKTAIRNLFTKPSTVKYPYVPVEAKPGYRGRIAYDAEKCVSCGLCMKACSPGAITMTSEKVEGGSNITYTFDMGSCTFCGFCATFCTRGAIKLTEDYHIVGTKLEDFLVSGTRFKPDKKVVVNGEDVPRAAKPAAEKPAEEKPADVKTEA